MKTMVASYLSKGALSERESAVLAGMLVEVLIDGIRRGASFDTLSTEMLDLWLNLSVVFFRLEQIPEAKEKLLDCIRQLHAES